MDDIIPHTNGHLGTQRHFSKANPQRKENGIGCERKRSFASEADKSGKLIRFYNCKLYRNARLVDEDLWIADGVVINPLDIFYGEKSGAEIEFDCGGHIISPGYVDLQINGGFGYDFSRPGTEGVAEGISAVSHRIVAHGVTSFCPTLVTLPRKSYHAILPLIKVQRRDGDEHEANSLHQIDRTKINGHNHVTCKKNRISQSGRSNKSGRSSMRNCADKETRDLSMLRDLLDDKRLGANVLGVHLEGPFISSDKRGAHPKEHVHDEEISSYRQLVDFYGKLDNVAILTLAPELDTHGDVTRGLVADGIVVSLGHSRGTLADGERAVAAGASFITHLFNAMLPFHHRDPGLVGLLSSGAIESEKKESNKNSPDSVGISYGIIADGIHTQAAAINIAYRTHPGGCVLVTDAMAAMGLESGKTHTIGTQAVEIVDGNRAIISGTNTLAGSVATMDECVRRFRQMTHCSVEEALKCATINPARVLRMTSTKGTLEFGSDADFIVLDGGLHVLATFIGGHCVWLASEQLPYSNK